MVEQVMVWRSYGQIFDSKEGAEEYEKSKEFDKAVADIVESFYWRGCDGEDVVQGIIQNKNRLIEVLRDQLRVGVEEQQPVAYADPQALINFEEARKNDYMGGPYCSEWMHAHPGRGEVPLYVAPVARVSPAHSEDMLGMVSVPRRSLERIVNHQEVAYVAGYLQDELRPFLDSPASE